MFDGRWRDSVERGTGPAGRRLVRMGITADMLTASGLVFAGATAVAVATGHLHLAIPLLAITGFHDLLDPAPIAGHNPGGLLLVIVKKTGFFRGQGQDRH